MMTEPGMSDPDPVGSVESLPEQRARAVTALRQLQCAGFQQGAVVRLEVLLAGCSLSHILCDEDLLELILAERFLRRSLGVTLITDEYLQRFPSLKQRLIALFDLDAALESEFACSGRDNSMSLGELVGQVLNSTSRYPIRSVSPEIAASETDIVKISDSAAESHFSPASLGQSISLHPGMQVGKYRLMTRLGQGGMGAVFRAAHTMIDYHVALKVMLPHLVQHPESQKRFLKEAQLCVSLQHPNLVRTLDVDQDGPFIYLTMELLDGSNLAQHVSNHGPIVSEVTADIIRQAAAGLAHAHAKGIIHRDIKPQNIMLTRDGSVKVLDLGLARLRDEYQEWQTQRAADAAASAVNSSGIGDPPAENPVPTIGRTMPNDAPLNSGLRLTASGAVMGTIAYMSPEQARNPRTADARSDLFSLGCTAYFLLTGRSLHGNASAADVLQAIFRDDDWHPLSLELIPGNWRPILQRMVAWNPEQRYASMEDLIAELDRVLGRGAVWLPAPDDLETLRSRLLQHELIADSDWNSAVYRTFTRRDSTTMSTSMMAVDSRIQTPAYQLLFELAKPTTSDNAEISLTQFQVQQILAGHISALRFPEHVVLEPLNNGWKGEIFRCRRILSRRMEVVRTIPAERLLGLGCSRGERIHLFQESIRKLSLLNHPRVGQIYDGQILEDLAIISAQYIPGTILGAEIRKNGCYSAATDRDRVLTSAIDMASGVAFLHDADILHLDLSTERWVRTPDGRLVLLDAGITSLLLPQNWKDIPDAAGLPPVLPPEMHGNMSAASVKADVFALGHVFRFLRTGQFPFQSMKLSELPRLQTNLSRVRKPRGDITHAAPRDESSTLSNTPKRTWDQEFDRLIDRMTIPEPALRLQSMKAVLEELDYIQNLTQSSPHDKSPGAVSSWLGKGYRRLFGRH